MLYFDLQTQLVIPKKINKTVLRLNIPLQNQPFKQNRNAGVNMDNAKRWKLTFNEDTCCFCKKRSNENKTVLDPTKSQSLFSASQKRTDDVSVNYAANENKMSIWWS